MDLEARVCFWTRQFLISLCSLVNPQNFSLLFYFRFVLVVLFLFSLWSYQMKPKNVSEGV